MISTLDVAFADVSARSLGWALDLPARPALASIVVGSDDGPQVELRLLGASHQVLVRADGSVLCSETVACDLPDAQPLPGSTRAGRYELWSDVRRLGPDAFAAAVDSLTGAVADRDDVLVGRFPDAPHATTILAVDSIAPHQVEWRTWHGYPQTGELVTTRTRLACPEVDR